MGPLQGGPGEGVEDPAAPAALEIHHGGAVAAVSPQVCPLPAARALQAIRMQQLDELGGAGILVQIVDQYLNSAPLPFPPGTRRVAVEPDVQQ